MTVTNLGKNGPQVTSLGIGTWQWGDELFWNYGKNYNADEVEKAFNAAVDAGVTFFDTAEVYGLGESETLLGKFIKNRSDLQINIATKYGPAPWRFNAESVYDAVTGSLKRLQLDKITLYQVHWSFAFLMSQETLMNALADEVEKGRIESIGVSNYSAEQMRQAHQILGKRGIALAVNQVQYSLLSRKVETLEIISAAKELDMTILAYSPLAQGLLTGKYTPTKANMPDGARRIDPRFGNDNLQKILPVLNLLKELGEKYQKTSAQVALNWLIAQNNVIPIPGAKNASQAVQNSGALGWQIEPAEVDSLEKISRPWL